VTTNLPLMFALCAAVGVFSSLIGVGGGILLVPIFTLLFKIPLLESLALSLCCVLATSITSSAKYLNSGLVDVRAALSLEITTLIFSYIGGRAVSLIPTRVAPTKARLPAGDVGVFRSAQHGRPARYRRWHRSGSRFTV
jgi:uncharacterized membrane protein YfcA